MLLYVNNSCLSFDLLFGVNYKNKKKSDATSTDSTCMYKLYLKENLQIILKDILRRENCLSLPRIPKFFTTVQFSSLLCQYSESEKAWEDS